MENSNKRTSRLEEENLKLKAELNEVIQKNTELERKLGNLERVFHKNPGIAVYQLIAEPGDVS
jgi:predicted RNase H-like nuclease (RuvC/YqgF family)